MRNLRLILVLVLTAALGAVPAIAAAAPFPAGKAPAASVDSGVAKASPASGMAGHHVTNHSQTMKHCPHCKPGMICAADACQFDCFKVFANLPEPGTTQPVEHARAAAAVPAACIGVTDEPQLPPPRA